MDTVHNVGYIIATWMMVGNLFMDYWLFLPLLVGEESVKTRKQFLLAFQCNWRMKTRDGPSISSGIIFIDNCVTCVGVGVFPPPP